MNRLCFSLDMFLLKGQCPRSKGTGVRRCACGWRDAQPMMKYNNRRCLSVCPLSPHINAHSCAVMKRWCDRRGPRRVHCAHPMEYRIAAAFRVDSASPNAVDCSKDRKIPSASNPYFGMCDENKMTEVCFVDRSDRISLRC
jgi:hypothetical protein